MEPLGNAEAYGHSLKDDEGSVSVEDELDELERGLDTLEEEELNESGDNDQSGEGDDAYISSE